MFRLGFFIAVFLIASSSLVAQEANEDIPTNNTVWKKSKPKKHKSNPKRYSQLYRKNTKGTLYGNPCAIDVTHKMGFEFVPLAQGHGKTTVGHFINNALVKTKLTFTRTPFWKLILNKRLKDCRLSSGDGIG